MATPPATAATIVAAPPKGASGFSLATVSDLGVPIAVLAIVVALITPMPAFLLDFLIVVDIMMSVIVMMVSMYITRPVEFNVFPTTLLLLTLFRLALNVSSSRLILLNGNTGTTAAGYVIQAFGNFAVGGNYIIGAVIFLVLIAIQYVVINHGAVRISEVTARFTLDSLPGKQMSIDSDLNSGLIDESEARRRRKGLAAEAEFYGAMDGASRFTQRDAIAGILITGINIVAGLLIGVFQHGVELFHAVQTYTVLTIGDGLVTVIPALMISISGGLIVTRASSDARLGTDFRKQVFGAAQPLLLSSGVMIVLALFPGLPKIPFMVLGVGLGVLGWRVRESSGDAQSKLPENQKSPVAQKDKESLDELLKVELLAVGVGIGLVSFVEGGANSPLLRRISAIRKQLAKDLGYILPPVRVTDNLALRARDYSISLKGSEVARYELPSGCELAIPVGSTPPPLEGQKTLEPAFRMPAVWIPAARADAARAQGYTVVDPVSVLGTHLTEVIRRYAHELFSRQETKKLLDRVAVDNPKVVEDLVPKLLPLSGVQRVLQNLLRERVSIRDGVSILEALGEAAGTTRNPVLLTEFVRQSVRRQLISPYLSQNGELAAWFIDPSIEQLIEAAVEHGENNSHVSLAPQVLRDIIARFTRAVGNPEVPVVAIASSGARYFLRQLLESAICNLFFVSHNEIPAGVRVQSLGVVN
jgi:flagellar biosynthesis protein FlhA